MEPVRQLEVKWKGNIKINLELNFSAECLLHPNHRDIPQRSYFRYSINICLSVFSSWYILPYACVLTNGLTHPLEYCENSWIGLGVWISIWANSVKALHIQHRVDTTSVQWVQLTCLAGPDITWFFSLQCLKIKCQQLIQTYTCILPLWYLFPLSFLGCQSFKASWVPARIKEKTQRNISVVF